MPEGAPAKRSLRHLVGALGSQLQTSWFLSATPNACAGSGECARACVRVGLWQTTAAAVGQCALCAALRWRATRACCARVRVGCACASACAARAPPVCAVCCVLLCALFVQLGGAGLAGRAARWAAARCGWLCACVMVCGGRSARPSRSSAARGAGMWSALHVMLWARLARMFPCVEGRA